MKQSLLAALAVVLISNSIAAGTIKVACIGDSITYGFLLEDRENDSYPSQLGRMLGEGYEVRNFGKSGATLLRHGHRPYFEQAEYAAALDFCPDIAVIHLGINDTDPRDWPNYNSEFVGDYMTLIAGLRQANPFVRIILARLTPLSARHPRFKSGTRDWRLQVLSAIDDVVTASGAELIDFDTPLRDRQNLLPDGIHPDKEGARILAKTVYGGITGDYGGLALPAVYQSGMVLQRDRLLTFSGKADAGSVIHLCLDGKEYQATADNRGDWSLQTEALSAGSGYVLTVTDARDTIRLEGIMAGEVWLASGQSNMAFPLASSAGGEQAVRTSEDSLLRIYDMRPVAYTDNVQWPDSVFSAVNSLEYFLPSAWQVISPENAGSFSAVAYYFARSLRDSLGVPVGVICNAVGGASVEAWIDVNYLEMGMPEVLVDWLDNDYVQPWVQERARRNMGTSVAGKRHPYEPSYLFSAGIRPLAHFALAGIIWYQGESNAHNIEIHEKLFPSLTESWRNNFDRDDLPFYFVQLSSLDRPSWPQFRDSQRRLAEHLPNTGMVVCSDVGDSLDVHPIDKAPVGKRLAFQALAKTYGFTDIHPDGPLPLRAVAEKDKVVLYLSDSYGLHTSDGLAPSTFELAETEGLYKEARAEIIDGKVLLYSPGLENPRFLRYGWQPFTRANLVNSEALPASTFKAEVQQAGGLPLF